LVAKFAVDDVKGLFPEKVGTPCTVELELKGEARNEEEMDRFFFSGTDTVRVVRVRGKR
jgi:hypothetical protein